MELLKGGESMEINERDMYAILRRKKRISLAEIGREIGCTRQHLSYYELGDRGLSKELLRKYRSYIDNN